MLGATNTMQYNTSGGGLVVACKVENSNAETRHRDCTSERTVATTAHRHCHEGLCMSRCEWLEFISSMMW
jgi:hypothetical protein